MADRTESSIVIAAPRASVLAVVADLECYPVWNDVKSVEVLGRDDLGRPVDAVFVIDSNPIKDTYQLRYVWAADEVSWSLVKATMLKALDGAYLFTDNDDATTTVTYRLAVDLSIPMIGLIKRRAEKAIVDTALRGLKERVEATP